MVPDSSGETIINQVLSDLYWYKPGISTDHLAYGSTSPSGSATISSTADATKGFIYLGDARSSAFDETNQRLGINQATPAARLHLTHSTGGGSTDSHPDSTVASGWGLSPGTPTQVAALASNDGDTNYVQSADKNTPGVGGLWAGSITDPGIYTGWVLHIVARKKLSSDGANISIILYSDNIGTSVQFSAADFLCSTGVPSNDAGLFTTTSYVDYLHALSTTEAGAIATSGQWSVKLTNGAGGDVGNFINVTEIYLALPGSINTTPLQRWNSTPISQTNNLNFASDGSSGFDLVLSGDAGLGITAGGGTSGLRLLTSSTNGRLEVGTSAQANMNLVMSGARDATGTLLTQKFSNTTLTGTITIAGGSPAAGSVLTSQDGTGLAAWQTFSSLLDDDLEDIAALTVNRGDMIIGSATSHWTDLAIGAANTFLRSSGTDPGWSTTVWTNSATQGDLLRASSANTYTNLAISSTAGTFLRSTGTDPAWSTLVLPNALTSGAILYGSATNTAASSAALTANGVVYGGGAGVAPATTAAGTTSQVLIGGTPPSFGNVPAAALDVDLQEIAAVANVRGDILITDSGPTWVRLGKGASGTFLRSDGTDVAWSTLVLPNASARGDILRGSSTANTASFLTIGSASTLLKSDGTDPSWGTVNLLSAFHGDTTAGTVARGDLITGQGASAKWVRLALGTTGKVLTSDGTDAGWSSFAFTGFATPSANSVNISAPTAGTATTAIRSDATLQLDQSINPTWTGMHIFDLNTLTGTNGTAEFDFRGTNDAGTTFMTFKDTDSGHTVSWQVSPLGADRTFTFPSTTSAFSELMFTTAKQSLTGKAMACNPTVGNIASCYFRDSVTTTKRIYWLLNQAYAGGGDSSTDNNSMSFFSTAARNWRTEDISGSYVICGNAVGSDISCTTNGTTTVTSSAAFGPVSVGALITGSGIPANTYVTAVASTSSITISNAATNSTTASRNFQPVAGQAAKINLTSLTANFASSGTPALLTNATVTGHYVITAVMTCTTAGSAGAGNVALNVTWTGDIASATKQPVSLTMTATGTATISIPLHLSSGSVTWYTTGYTSGTYAVRLRMSYLGS